jgi:predicted AAA+ superfamily ATPase
VQQLNLSALSADLGVSVNTVKRWISILEACRIILLLQPYYVNLGKRIAKAPKAYFTDCGLVCHLIRLTDADHLLHGPMVGPLFQNFCVQEALKAVLNAGRQPRLYYLRTQAGLEVDLLVEGKSGTLIPFEFKAAQTPRKEMAAALGQFRETFAALNPGQGFVVSFADRRDSLTASDSLLPFRDFAEMVSSAA